MIVCHCKGITDREIRRDVCRPHGDQASAKALAGSGCGGCLPLVREIERLAAARAQGTGTPHPPGERKAAG